MSLKKVTQVKADKGFKLPDLIIYCALLVLVAVTFIVVFTTRDDSPLKGIRIYVKSEIVYEYDFKNGQRTINGKFTQIISQDDDLIVLKITTGGDGYNLVQVNKKGTVKVTEANCGKNDCVYTPQIKNSSGIIYCSPHKVKIVPYDFDVDDSDIII